MLDPIVGPVTGQWTAPDLSAGFGSVTVYNASTLPVSLYIGQLNFQGTPLIVPAQSTVTYPIPGTVYLSAQFGAAAGIISGNCQIQIIDTVLAGQASNIPGSIGAPGIFPSASSMQWDVTSLVNVPSNDGAASSAQCLINALAAYPVYIYSMSISLCVDSPAPVFAFLRLVSTSTGGTEYRQWVCISPFQQPSNAPAVAYFGQLVDSISGGPLPLLVLPAGAKLWAQYGDYNGEVAYSTGEAEVNLTYCQF